MSREKIAVDTTLAAGLIGAGAALLGALIGGALALVGAERTVRGAFTAAAYERQTAYRSLLTALRGELIQNVEAIGHLSSLSVWVPLSHAALDRFLATANRGIPASVFNVVDPIAKYNALATMTVAIFQAGRDVPKEIQNLLTKLAPTVKEALELAENDVGGLNTQAETWANNMRTRLDALNQHGPLRRWWALILNPLPSPPSGMPGSAE